MGKRMQKNWGLVPEQAGALIVLSLSFLAGGGAGCLFARLASGVGAQGLTDFLSDYLHLAWEGTVVRSLWPVLWEQLRYILLALLLGITVIGILGLPVLFFLRGFCFAFSVACFCRVFGGGGLFPAFCLFGLPALVWAPALFLAGTQGFTWAAEELRYGTGRGRSPFEVSCWCRAGLCVLLVLLCGLMEYTIVPVLLRVAARFALEI